MAKSHGQEKTNVIRILDQKKISYHSYYYQSDGPMDGLSVAHMLRQNPDQVFKTLVARGKEGIYVFVIPVAKELDLKKAAKAVSAKAVALIHVNELLPLTGYIRGGCSPIGMKKQYQTVIEKSALAFSEIIFSAGKIGAQVALSPQELASLTSASFAEIAIAP